MSGILETIKNVVPFGASFVGRRLTPLNKDHLKNVMVFISKLFNGVNADHQNLCRQGSCPDGSM